MSTTSDDSSASSESSSSSDDDDTSSASSHGNQHYSDHDEAPYRKVSRRDSDESSSSEDDDDEEEEDERESSSHLPLGQRLEQEAAYGAHKKHKDKKATTQSTVKKNKKSSSTTTKEKKKSKHAPTEASSKRSDFFATLRQTQIGGVGTGIDLGAHRYQPKDPRNNNLHGHLQEDHFQQNYSFVQDLRKQEIKALQRNIHAWKTPGRKGQELRRKLGLTTNTNASLQGDQDKVKELRQEIADWERQEIERAAHRSVKQKLQEQVSTTGKFYFPKRRDLKKMQDDAKIEELRKRKGEGAVEKALAKRRKKNKSKDASLWAAK